MIAVIIRTLIRTGLGLANLGSYLAHFRCWQCGKRLKLKVVKANDEFSIECRCCWELSLDKD